MGIVIVMASQPDLTEIIRARHSASSFTGLLDSWEKQGNQHTNDGNYHQKFDEGKAERTWAWHGKVLQ